MRSFGRVGSALVWVVIGAGCSAIVNPDPGRLRGSDGGQGELDASQSDGGRADAGRDDAGSPDDGAVCPPSCDDSIACTADSCVSGACTHIPSDAACGDGERCNATMGCVPLRCTSDGECDDGLYCNGVERCDPSMPGTGCVSGAAPECDDGASCTTDGCDETTDACAHVPSDAACEDTFACTADRCDPGAADDPSGCVHTPDDAMCATDFCSTGGTCSPTAGCVGGGTPRDCRDGDPCTTDSCDSAAAMCVHARRDDDGDGYPLASSGGTACPGGTDCNDANAAVHPGATEVCGNRADDNCNGMVDEGCTSLADDCAMAGTIDLRTTASAMVTGSFASLRDDYQTSPLCSAATGGRDAVYAVILPRGTFDVTIDTIGSSADTVLGFGAACTSSDLRAACNDDYAGASVSTASRIWLHRGGSAFTETTFYVLVDAYSSSVTGGFQLNVRRADARRDACPSSFSGLAFSISGGGTLVGVQTEFVGSTRGSCQGSFDTSPEAVLHFGAGSSGVADFEVYSVDFVPDVYVRSAPCSSGTELACVVGTSIGGGVNRAALRRTGLTGDNFLFVDGGRTGYVVYYRPY